ncbi:MAG TPA: DUF2071 domain-containing protein [Gaiellaceae bacterium]
MIAELLETPARQAGVMAETAHRPWPVPAEPWVLGQTWDELLFAHWRVPLESVRQLVPERLDVDEYDGSAWLGITPFVLRGFRFRGTLPLPRLSTFPELNVRTYVSAGGKAGIWFFSLDTSSLLAVEGARRAYKLPYFRARTEAVPSRGGLRFTCIRAGSEQRFEAWYRGRGEGAEATPGSLEWFLTERYCLYVLDGGGLARAEIHHPPWRLERAEAELDENTIAPEPLTPQGEPCCHFSRRQNAVIWPLRPV